MWNVELMVKEMKVRMEGVPETHLEMRSLEMGSLEMGEVRIRYHYHFCLLEG